MDRMRCKAPMMETQAAIPMPFLGPIWHRIPSGNRIAEDRVPHHRMRSRPRDRNPVDRAVRLPARGDFSKPPIAMEMDMYNPINLLT